MGLGLGLGLGLVLGSGLGLGFGLGLGHLAGPGALGVRGRRLGAVVRAHVLLALERRDQL